MDRIEKVQVRKSSGVFTFTIKESDFKELDNGWIQIKTVRGETLKFRKEQIEDRKIIKEVGDHDD